MGTILTNYTEFPSREWSSLVARNPFSPAQKVITLLDLQKIYSYVEHSSIEQYFILKRDTSVQNDENKRGTISNVVNQMITIIRIVE